MGYFLHSSIVNYVARLDAEFEGWRLYVNANRGPNKREQLPPRVLNRDKYE